MPRADLAAHQERYLLKLAGLPVAEYLAIKAAEAEPKSEAEAANDADIPEAA